MTIHVFDWQPGDVRIRTAVLRLSYRFVRLQCDLLWDCNRNKIARKMRMSKFHVALLRRLVQRCDFVRQKYESLLIPCDFIPRQAVAWLLYDLRERCFNINWTLPDLEHSCNGKQPGSEWDAEWLGIYFGVNPFASRPTGFSNVEEMC